MPYRITRVERTPNPNAIKCLVEPGPGSIRSYFNADQARGDPLASALFALEGVTNVLIHEHFISINKAPDADWPPLKRAIEQALAVAP
ncbi:MAG: NifU N-terminal domain-containing protein [Planctomycetota bacterium]|mgnify:CR=1 FL=1